MWKTSTIKDNFGGSGAKKSLKLGHTDITTLEKVCDQYGKGKFVQMEALSAGTNLINSKVVPTVQFELP
ncbi:hypothetical protein COF36_23210 [Bacillus pseudomycoides]|nr:hypothetical protein COF36_23210 [Bacillus pseudomycoides]